MGVYLDFTENFQNIFPFLNDKMNEFEYFNSTLFIIVAIQLTGFIIFNLAKHLAQLRLREKNSSKFNDSNATSQLSISLSKVRETENLLQIIEFTCYYYLIMISISANFMYLSMPFGIYLTFLDFIILTTISFISTYSLFILFRFESVKKAFKIDKSNHSRETCCLKFYVYSLYFVLFLVLSFCIAYLIEKLNLL